MVRLLPAQFTVVLVLNPLPLIVSVNAPDSAIADAGLKVVSTGTGLLTTKVSLRLPPPGVGLTTVIVMFAAVNTSDALTAIVIAVDVWVSLVLLEPEYVTVVFGSNPVPLIVNVRAPLSASTEAGENELMVGVGYSTSYSATAGIPSAGAGGVT